MIRRGGTRDRHPAPSGSGGGPRPSNQHGLATLAVSAVVALLMPVAVVAGSERRPNDRMYDDQWALENTGQMGPDWDEGTPGADINATEAWGLTTGSKSVVIGLIDQDLDYEAQDLAANVWESSEKVNKCPAGTHGYHVPTQECAPNRDGGGHGSDMAHVMGAVGHNETGLAGVNWTTAIMGVTYGSSKDIGTVSEALDWVIRAKQDGVNVRVINASWGAWVSNNQTLEDKIAKAGDHGILVVTGAGNSGDNNDADPQYPCNFGMANQLCVAATDHDDELWTRSNYGAKSVDLAAPGENICTTPQNEDCIADGSSLSTAFVSGAAALILAHEPGLSVGELKARILDNVRPVDALDGKVATGGVLDVYCAMTDCRADSDSPSSSSSTSSTTTTTSGSSSSSTTTTSGSSPSTEPGDDGSSTTGGSGGSTGGTSGTGGGTSSDTTSGGGGTGDNSGTSDGSGSSTGGSSGGAFWDPTTSGDSGGDSGDGGDLSLVTGSDTSGTTDTSTGSTGGGTTSNAGGTATPGTPGGASTAGGDSGGTQATDGEDGSSGMPRQPLAVDRPSADDEAGSPWSATTVTALVAILFLALAARMLYVEATRRLARHR